jgi:hypothetical protein
MGSRDERVERKKRTVRSLNGRSHSGQDRPNWEDPRPRIPPLSDSWRVLADHGRAEPDDVEYHCAPHAALVCT